MVLENLLIKPRFHCVWHRFTYEDDPDFCKTQTVKLTEKYYPQWVSKKVTVVKDLYTVELIVELDFPEDLVSEGEYHVFFDKMIYYKAPYKWKEKSTEIVKEYYRQLGEDVIVNFINEIENDSTIELVVNLTLKEEGEDGRRD